jgi:ABC-2 type transport system permease protein
MRNALLVAAREFGQLVRTRGFWVTLLVVPLVITVTTMAGRLLAPQPSVAWVMVDATGQYAPLIERRLELGYQRQVLGDFAAYAERWKLARFAPGAVWASGQDWFGDAAVARFIAEGGSAGALRRIGPRLPPDAPAFEPPARPYVQIQPPPGVPSDQGAEAFGKAITPIQQGDVVTPGGKLPLALAIYIPKDFGEPGVLARMWTNGRSNPLLIDIVRQVLTNSIRARMLQSSGLQPGVIASLESAAAPLQITEPAAGGGRDRVIVRSVMPLALVYLLLVTSITTGSMMLQGVIEERSNKLLESVLACIRPGELMYGKLIGLGAVGLTIVTFWSSCIVAAAYLTKGPIADTLQASLTALDRPWMIGALLFYFLSGYLIVSMIFLAIGSLSDSFQDAQAYLTPVIMLIMLPTVFMMQASLRSPDSVITHVLSWIPLYTPFAMLARLANGVALPEMLGTGALVVAFVALELLLLGRVFRASLLSSGQPPRLATFARLMFRSPEA